MELTPILSHLTVIIQYDFDTNTYKPILTEGYRNPPISLFLYII